MASGTLYVVATPIGNLEDITARALRILREVDLIAAEDTRHSIKLLNHFSISKPLISYWSEKEKIKAEEIIAKLLSGMNVALISDAGTPGISDPGSVLIRRCIEEGVNIIPIPGPSAVTSALSVSGLPTEEFTFIGFLPPKGGQRQKKLADLSHESRTLVFYEAPHRIVQTLHDMKEILGDRMTAVFKEISKLHEKIVRGNLSAIIPEIETSVIAGEYVIAIEGFRKEGNSFEEALSEVHVLMKKGLGRKEAAKVVSERYLVSKRELYDKSLGQ